MEPRWLWHLLHILQLRNINVLNEISVPRLSAKWKCQSSISPVVGSCLWMNLCYSIQKQNGSSGSFEQWWKVGNIFGKAWWFYCCYLCKRSIRFTDMNKIFFWTIHPVLFLFRETMSYNQFRDTMSKNLYFDLN